MSKVFRAKFAAALRKQFPSEPQILYDKLFKQNRVVYAKQPFAGPQQVIEYLGRYTHKIAISNHRIQSVQANAVHFAYKDYRDAAKKKTMCLQPVEFIRRFAMHILPKRLCAHQALRHTQQHTKNKRPACYSSSAKQHIHKDSKAGH